VNLARSTDAAIFASTIALLTNDRIAAGKPRLGFLNPLIYANPDVFNDLKTGKRAQCLLVTFLRSFRLASFRE
jgi:tripeptidyl-peptidase-1